LIVKKIFKSRKFEVNSFLLRRLIPILNDTFNKENNINLATYSEKSKALQIKQKKIESTLADIKDNSNFLHCKAFNKTIWFYWSSNIECAPSVVKRSYTSWKLKNPDFDIILLNDENLIEHLGLDFMSIFYLASVNLNRAIKADILRLYLLYKYGGTWADATTFCIQPLSEWLPQTVDLSHLFIFRNPNRKTAIRPAEVWFIYSSSGHPVIKETLNNLLVHIFKKRRTTLFVSNSKLKKVTDVNSIKPLGSAVVYTSEKYGFFPYFSTGFFLYQALVDHKVEQLSYWELVTALTNNHVTNHDDFDTFQKSLVSKQTYKKTYQDSDIFKNRCDYLSLND
jgi:mannosyltransferase OCH1-like enzyme